MVCKYQKAKHDMKYLTRIKTISWNLSREIVSLTWHIRKYVDSSYICRLSHFLNQHSYFNGFRSSLL